MSYWVKIREVRIAMPWVECSLQGFQENWIIAALFVQALGCLICYPSIVLKVLETEFSNFV